MLLQAAGLALLASISPTALLIAATYLASARPRLTATFYLCGAVAMSLVMGIVILLVLRNAGLSHPSEHDPRYGVRLGLGIVLLAAALAVARRRGRPTDPAKERPGLLSRMTTDPRPRTAFLVGLLVFAPGATFLAALQVIATARAGIELTAVAVIVVIVINVLLVWVPIVLHIVAPEPTTRYLTAFNGWLRAHGQTVLVWVLAVAGGVMIGNGIYGLAGG
jgi:hypothetical protein